MLNPIETQGVTNNQPQTPVAAGQEVVNNEGQQPVQQTTVEQTAIPNEAGQLQVDTSAQTNISFDALDESGVPWKNRAHEFERKYKETIDNLPKIIDEQLAQRQTQQQPQKYTIEQLEQFAQSNPEHRPWVESEKAKIIQENLTKSIEQKFAEKEAFTKNEQLRRQSYQYVIQSYPEAFIKDAYGNTQFNVQSPIVKEMSVIMQDPRLKDLPDAVSIAADLAYARIARKQVSQVQSQVNGLKNVVQKVQRQSMVEGGTGNDAIQQRDELSSAMETMRKSGGKRAEEDVVRAYLKKAGHI